MVRPGGEKTMSETRIQSFREFYPYYLSEHRNGACRVCHFVGSSLVLGLLGYVLLGGPWQLAMALPFAGYGPAWVGHFFFEKNRPATFTYPRWSFLADWVMMKDIVTGRLPLLGELPPQAYEAS